jgi:Clp amino terminal domain, pathogenicity island component
VPGEELSGSYLEAISRGFQFARELGHGCRPVHFLVGVAGGRGPAAAALAAGAGRPLREVVTAASDIPADSAAYLHGQAQGAAVALADSLGQRPAAEHLLVALIDQGTAEVLRALSRAGLDPAAIRGAALVGIGAPAEQPAARLPPLAPAGSLDRPPLPVIELDERAWRVLAWRHDHLPLDRLRRAGHRQALSRLERDEASRLADRLSLDEDQRYSLIWHHDAAVEQQVAVARPALPGPPEPRVPWPLRSPGFLAVAAGWAVWVDNRRVNLRDRWFKVRTLRHYHAAPHP